MSARPVASDQNINHNTNETDAGIIPQINLRLCG